MLSDPAAFPLLGRKEAGAVIPARVIRHDPDGLTELATSGGRLILPGVAAAPGATVRVRIRARDVILAQRAAAGPQRAQRARRRR